MHNVVIKQHRKKSAKIAKVIVTAKTIMFIPSINGGGVLSVSPARNKA